MTLFSPLMQRSCRRRGKRSTHSACARLVVEPMEDRTVPAILHVGPGEPYATIQAAVNATHPHDTVKVDAGVYQEQLTINKSISVVGDGASTVILAPSSLVSPTPANPDAIVRVTGSGVHALIEHFTIEGAARGTPNLYYGIRIDGNAAAEIEHNVITNIIDASDSTLGVAIDVGNSVGSADGTGDQVGAAKIEHNTIDNYQRAGIVINHGGSFAEVQSNKITGMGANSATNQTGVEISNGAVAKVESNAVSGNANPTLPVSAGAGILLVQPGAMRLSGGDGDQGDFQITEVSGNKLSDNDYGIFGDTVTPSFGDQTISADIENNGISGSTFVGIEFDNSSAVFIHDNNLFGNGSGNPADGGIYLFNSTNNTLAENVSKNNQGSGITVDSNSTGNTLRNNRLTGNVFSDANQSADAVDLSSGTGTSGTANCWIDNHGKTFIDNSDLTLFV
jgi:parallel beta-helix repeat protein